MSQNRGWKSARGERIAFLAADMLPAPNWLEAHTRALESKAATVVSGVSRHLEANIAPRDGLPDLLQRLDFPASGLARSDAAHPSCLRSCVPSGWRPTSAPRSPELDLPSPLKDRPIRSSHAHSINCSNLMMTKAILAAAGGFAPLLNRGEDLNLEIRLADLGATFMIAEDAVTYDLTGATESSRDWTDLEREAFVYRNPTRSALMRYLQESHGFQNDTTSDIATTCDPERSGWRKLLTEISPRLIPGHFVYSSDDLVNYFSEESGLGHDTIRDYLMNAVTDGLLVRQSINKTYFDLYHTSNYLRTRTLYREHCLKHASYARSHQTPLQRKTRAAAPISIHCRGVYTLNLVLDPTLCWDSVSLNICIPIEHDCQKNVRLTRLTPPQLDTYIDNTNGLFASVPSSLLIRNSGQISYEFECDITEAHISTRTDSKRYERDNAGGGNSANLRFNYPSAFLDKTASLLEYILEDRRSDPETDVRRIFRWILENLSYVNTPLRDYSILETGIGTCVQLSRLFANLVRLRGVPAREQCGALMVRGVLEGEVESIATEYSPFAHTWVEVYLDGRGWCPVEFIVMRYGEWEATPLNVGPDLRAEMVAQTSRLADYYFGNVDPYRVYANTYANRISPIIIPPSDRYQGRYREFLSRLHHRLSCSVSEY